jgi:hypothetical protein
VCAESARPWSSVEVRAIRVLERMEDDCASLVVCDSDGARRVAAPIVGPTNIACEHVLGSLQPLEADHSRGANFGIAGRDSCRCEDVNFLACGSRLNKFGPPAQSDAAPWVRELMVEQVRIESTYDIPCTRT